MRLTAADAGALAALAGHPGALAGGSLAAEGAFDDGRSPAPLALALRIRDLRVVDAPVMARVLAVASITGIPQLLGGAGIAFDRVDARLVRLPNLLRIEEMIASGVAMGFTVKGTISGADDVADLQGEVVPVNFVNRIIGVIPLLGDVLTGGPGGGILAIGYRLRGPLADPQVSVNPLTALTPGFLRRIFDDPDPNAPLPPPTERDR